MIDITEQDGELLIDGKPVDFQAPWKVEDAIRQLRAEIAERDARIAELEANLASVRGCFSKASIKRGQAEAELAQLRAQEPVAWMWNDMIGIPHTHISPTRPTWPDDGASHAMSVAIDVRPLYAEPMPAPSIKDHEIAQLVNALRDCAVEFHAAQQLRERIAAIVVPMLRGVRSPMSAKDSK